MAAAHDEDKHQDFGGGSGNSLRAMTPPSAELERAATEALARSNGSGSNNGNGSLIMVSESRLGLEEIAKSNGKGVDVTAETGVYDPSATVDYVPVALKQNTEDLPTEIGEYRIHKRFGKGGMGEVFEASHDLQKIRENLRTVAAKRLGIIEPADSSLNFLDEGIDEIVERELQLHQSFGSIPDSRVDEFRNGIRQIQLQEKERERIHLRNLNGRGEKLTQAVDVLFRGRMDELKEQYGLAKGADDAELEKLRFALKVSISGNEEARERFRSEFLEQRRFEKDCGIARVYEHQTGVIVDDQNGRARSFDTYTMEILNGPLPSRAMSTPEGTPDFESIIKYTKEAARILHFMHEAGSIHRDVKPANMMLRLSEGKLKEQLVITDLGLNKAFAGRSLTQEGQIIGTPYYWSPEQATAEHVDRKSDIFSLGASVYQWITGMVPKFRMDVERLEGESDGDYFFRNLDGHKKSAIDPKSDLVIIPRDLAFPIDKNLEAIVLKMLEKDPEKRYQTGQELIDDIERYERGERVHAKISKMRLYKRWKDRHPAVKKGIKIAKGALLTTGILGVLGIGANEIYKFATSDIRSITNALTGASATIGGLDLTSINYESNFRSAETAEDILEKQRERIESLIANGAEADKFDDLVKKIDSELIASGEASLKVARDWFTNATEYQDMRDAAKAYATRLARDRILDWFGEGSKVLPEDGSIPTVGENNGLSWQSTLDQTDINVPHFLRLLKACRELTGNEMFSSRLETYLKGPKVADALTEEEIEAINSTGGANGFRAHVAFELGRDNLGYRLTQKSAERVREDGTLQFTTGTKEGVYFVSGQLENLYALLDAQNRPEISVEDKTKFKDIATTTLNFVIDNMMIGGDVAQGYNLKDRAIVGSTTLSDRAAALEIFTTASDIFERGQTERPYQDAARRLFEKIKSSRGNIDQKDLLGISRTAYALTEYARNVQTEHAIPARELAIDLLRLADNHGIDLTRGTLVNNSKASKKFQDNPDIKVLTYITLALQNLSESYSRRN